MRPSSACLTNSAIVRNRRKIESAVRNAGVVQAIAKEAGGFDRYVWSFVGGRPKRNAWKAIGQIPAQTAESRAMSKDLIKRGANFVGPTICYAFMQGPGWSTTTWSAASATASFLRTRA